MQNDSRLRIESPASVGTVGDLTERDLIGRLQARLPPPPDWLSVGIGDDAAVVEPEKNRLEVLSVDALVEGVHFDRRFTPPLAIGYRALAVNLSDLAAMGAAPRLALLSLALPPALSIQDFDAVVSGIVSLAAREKVVITGGNLTRSPGPLMIDVTVFGTIKRRQVLKRSGARAGHEVFVTGTIGAAAAGLQMLRVASSAVGSSAPAELEPCIRRYLYPEPRLRVGVLLARNRAASACIDLSDGLADGVREIAEASGVGITIEAGAVPVDSSAMDWFRSRRLTDPELEAVTAGDDYELLFTIAPRDRGRLKPVMLHGRLPLTRIGVCTSDCSVVFRRAAEGGWVDCPLPRGYSHFR